MVGAMAQPLPVRKQSVDLAGGPRKVGSRIRRAPPPKAEKPLSAAEVREREAWMMGIGILSVALALMIVLLYAARWGGWSPSDYAIMLDLR
jgi:hypothetical protein